jgi:hypothetical protein
MTLTTPAPPRQNPALPHPERGPALRPQLRVRTKRRPARTVAREKGSNNVRHPGRRRARYSRSLTTDIEILDKKVCAAMDELTVLEMVRTSNRYVSIPADDEVVNAELNRQITAKSADLETLTARLEILERARLIVREQLPAEPAGPKSPPLSDVA